jgi:23S rRNA (uracil1939-C5)-methyltransferase
METQKVKIEKLVSGGHGLGRLNGRVVLTPFSVPGDEVLLEVHPARRGVTWGNIREIVSPAPARVKPFCAHYTRCGGCQLQHISYPAQAECKRLIVEDALRRLGGLKGADVGPCVASPAQTGYRTRARLHYERGEIGFHRAGSNTIQPLEQCPVLTERINDCLAEVSSYLSAHPLKDLREIQMMQDSYDRIMLTFEMNGFPSDGAVKGLHENISASGAVARVGHRTRHLWGEKYSSVIINERIFRVSPAVFFQANASMLPALIEHVLQAVKNDIDAAVELYAGVGLFSVMLSDGVKRIVAAEWNEEAVEDAKANLRENKIENVEVLILSAEDALDSLISQNFKPELVVMDPPRQGLSNPVRLKLLHLSPRQMIYVSCDPATLARDLKSFLASGQYRLESVLPLDMFPHSAHVECICSLTKD